MIAPTQTDLAATVSSPPNVIALPPLTVDTSKNGGNGHATQSNGHAAPILLDLASCRPIKRWTVREAHRLFDEGLLDGQRYELLEGQLVEKVAQGMDRGDGVMLFIEHLGAAFGMAYIQTQRQIDIGEFDEFSDPEPDVAVLREPRRLYLARKIVPRDDVLLAVEVGLSSLADDLDRKSKLYARHGVREYWIVDVAGRVLHVRREPDEETGDWKSEITLTSGDTIAPLARPDVLLSVGDLLPEVAEESATP